MINVVPYQPNSLLILCRVTIVQHQSDYDLLQHATEFFQTILRYPVQIRLTYHSQETIIPVDHPVN